MRVLILLVAAVVLLLMWKSFAGQDVPDAPPINGPKNPQDLANDAADGLLGAPGWVWRFAAPIIILCLVLMHFKKKYPVLFWLGIGILVCLLAVYTIKKP